MQDETFDVAIVGYGPVGQMVAILLGQNGCEAVLVRPDFYVFGAVRRLEEVPDLVADLQAQLAGFP